MRGLTRPFLCSQADNLNSPEHFLDWAFDEVQRLTAKKGELSLTVQTTVDMELQQYAVEAVSNVLLPNRKIKRVF